MSYDLLCCVESRYVVPGAFCNVSEPHTGVTHDIPWPPRQYMLFWKFLQPAGPFKMSFSLVRKAGERWYTALEAKLLVSFTHPTAGESIVPYDRSSRVGGGRMCQGSSSCSFSANKVGVQSQKNQSRTLKAAAKKSAKPSKASHPHPMINPRTSRITPAAPSNTGRRYGDGLL
jgi:hypothetical protein